MMTSADDATPDWLLLDQGLELFRRVFFSSPDYIAFSDLEDGTYIDVNPGFEKLVGFKREDVIGKTSFEIGLWPDEGSQRAAYVEALKRDGRVQDYPMVIRNAMGGILEMEASASIINARGRKILIAIGKDVTARMQAMRALEERETAYRTLSQSLEQRVLERTAQLRASESRLRSIFDASFQLMGMMDSEGRLIDVNRAWASTFGHESNTDIGRVLWELPCIENSSAGSARIRAHVSSALAGNATKDEICIENGTSKRIFALSFRPVPDADHVVIGAVCEAAELTSQRHAEDALRQAQKMEAVGQLTGGIAHDFNNILAGISGNVHLLKVGLIEGNARYDSLHRYVEALESIVERATTLTRRLLSFSRRQAVVPTVVDVGCLLVSMTEWIRRTVPPAIEIGMTLSDDIGNVLCDAHQLEGVLLNLVINARDAMEAGGKMVITAESRALEESLETCCFVLPPGRYVVISVSDTGTGMVEEVRKRAFEPFFTTKSPGHGTGLGLAMVLSFVHQLSGGVQIDSELGVGTTVSIYLPRNETLVRESSVSQPAFEADGMPQLGKVLVVEDDAALRKVLVEFLSRAGHTVFQAKNGAEAFNMLIKPLAFDLLVADIGLPGSISGVHLAELARLVQQGIEVILISGFAEENGDISKATSAGIRLLNKPFPLQELLDATREALHRKFKCEPKV